MAEKTTSVFFPEARLASCRRNAASDPWVAGEVSQIVLSAAPWLKYSDDQLWEAVFGATIQRSHMVLSDGACPSCGAPVRMYDWKHDALRRPWKVWCPHCSAAFPTNDFESFYRSGLDERGVFDPDRADRSLLFNTAHPDTGDPLHRFGVDDGEGYVNGGKRWRFIGWYLNFAQWTEFIYGGITKLAAAHAVTGDAVYAHKAGILLDRLADVWPDFDYRTQGFVYEKRKRGGSIRYSIDNCMQVRGMALAYDQIFGALGMDADLVRFLSEKARTYKVANPKSDFAAIRRNIEQRLFGHALSHPDSIASNYPQPDITRAVVETVLHWPTCREKVCEIIDDMVQRGTAVDGVSGEKGLVGYGTWAIRGLAQVLARFSWVEGDFLAQTFARNPVLESSWRFPIDVWSFQRYYPLNGDSGSFSRRIERYCGVEMRGKHRGPLDPSMYTFLWDLYRLTGDLDYVRIMVHENEGTVESLPRDLFAQDATSLRSEVSELIAAHGAEIVTGSVNKQQWHLAILRTGSGPTGRAAWLDYDSGGAHGQCDGMNIGLIAYGMDFMPEYGYPPVGFGGWVSAKARWYRGGVPTHNTVCVDGKMQNWRSGKLPSGLPQPAAGRTTLWADGEAIKLIRASGPEIVEAEQYERTVAMVPIGADGCYLIDIFRVAGGADHAKFQHTQNGTVQMSGLSLAPGEPYVCELGHDQTSESVLRNFRYDRNPAPGWSVDWAITPFYEDSPADAHFRYTDFTSGGEAALCDQWVLANGAGAGKDGVIWLPSVMVRRRGEVPLHSTFVAVMEPYCGAPPVIRSRRLPLVDAVGRPAVEADVALLIETVSGGRDMFVCRDVEDPFDLSPSGEVRQVDTGLTFSGDLCFVRLSPEGAVSRLVLCNVRSLSLGELRVSTQKAVPYVEIGLAGDRMDVAGDADSAGLEVTLGGKTIRPAP